MDGQPRDTSLGFPVQVSEGLQDSAADPETNPDAEQELGAVGGGGPGINSRPPDEGGFITFESELVKPRVESTMDVASAQFHPILPPDPEVSLNRDNNINDLRERIRNLTAQNATMSVKLREYEQLSALADKNTLQLEEKVQILEEKNAGLSRANHLLSGRLENANEDREVLRERDQILKEAIENKNWSIANLKDKIDKFAGSGAAGPDPGSYTQASSEDGVLQGELDHLKSDNYYIQGKLQDAKREITRLTEKHNNKVRSDQENLYKAVSDKDRALMLAGYWNKQYVHMRNKSAKLENKLRILQNTQLGLPGHTGDESLDLDQEREQEQERFNTEENPGLASAKFKASKSHCYQCRICHQVFEKVPDAEDACWYHLAPPAVYATWCKMEEHQLLVDKPDMQKCKYYMCCDTFGKTRPKGCTQGKHRLDRLDLQVDTDLELPASPGPK